MTMFAPIPCRAVLVPCTADQMELINQIMHDTVDTHTDGGDPTARFHDMPLAGRIMLLRCLDVLDNDDLLGVSSAFYARDFHSDESWNASQAILADVNRIFEEITRDHPEAVFAAYARHLASEMTPDDLMSSLQDVLRTIMNDQSDDTLPTA